MLVTPKTSSSSMTQDQKAALRQVIGGRVKGGECHNVSVSIVSPSTVLQHLVATEPLVLRRISLLAAAKW